MTRTQVVSSNVASIGYEDGTLEIEYRSGGVYAWQNVPQEVYEQMLSAPSIGAFVSAMLKDKYPCERMT